MERSPSTRPTSPSTGRCTTSARAPCVRRFSLQPPPPRTTLMPVVGLPRWPWWRLWHLRRQGRCSRVQHGLLQDASHARRSRPRGEGAQGALALSGDVLQYRLSNPCFACRDLRTGSSSSQATQSTPASARSPIPRSTPRLPFRRLATPVPREEPCSWSRKVYPVNELIPSQLRRSTLCPLVVRLLFSDPLPASFLWFPCLTLLATLLKCLPHLRQSQPYD